MALQRYAGLLAAAFEDPAGILPEDASRLAHYCDRHALSSDDHDKALQLIDYSPAQFEARVALGTEVSTYLHVVAATLQQPSGRLSSTDDATLALYRERHAVSATVHAAALTVLGVPSVTAGEPEALEPYTSTYRRMLAVALQEERAEQPIADSANEHGLPAAFHSATARALGDGAATADAARLERRLRQIEAANAERRIEIDRVGSAMQAAEARVHESIVARPPLAAEVAQLEQALREVEVGNAQLRSKMAMRRSQLGEVQRLLDAREAELYETEDAVRECEGREHERARELAAIEAKLGETESLLACKQRELMGHMALPDAATGAQRRHSGRAGVDASSDDDDDEGMDQADARAMREVARRRDTPGGAQAGYVHFHTVCMGVKLSMSGHGRLRNVRIDDLWEEARRQQLPRSEWPTFVRQRLLAPPTAPAHFSIGDVTAPLAAGVQVMGGAIQSLGAGAWAALGKWQSKGSSSATDSAAEGDAGVRREPPLPTPPLPTP